ncbi:MAG: adenine/guanine/hypoxanthine permease [Actinomycetota bacterium]|jgi:AGZA family xanthine/uracil permease-like MFS transporter|nr:adenine/guanine/hypoxanthine permease [Actinomycetota bacterium]
MSVTSQGTSTSSFDRWFELSARGSTYGREVRGGFVTFFTMAYIVVLNPLIIGTAKDMNGDYVGGTTDVVTSIAMVTAATALVAGVMTILMGAIGRFPIAIAAGLGLNGFVAFTLAPQMTWADAMGLVVLEGLLILLLVLTGFRSAVFTAVPEQLKYAIGVGIGLFITIIGLVDAGIVRTGVPLITFGNFGELQGWPIFTFCFGLLLTIVLVVRKVKGAILIGILATTVLAIVIEAIADVGAKSADNPLGWGLNVPRIPDSVVASPDLGLLGQFNLFGSFEIIGVVASLLAIFSLMLSDFFDTMGTAFGLATEAELLDEEGQIPHFESILVVDSLSAVAGGAASTSSNTAYIESASGIGEGARTGIASLVTGALFLVAMLFSPLVTIVPYEAATPALVVVGFLMMTQIRHIDFTDYSIGIPAFLTIALMPFTYSITNGIGAGFVTWVVIKVFTGRVREVNWLMWVVSLAFVVYFAIYPIEVMFGLK